jgi:hypothetical protein
MKTVFVIGAGASKEANLPTGHELKEKISNLLNIRFDFSKQISGDYHIVNALKVITKKPDSSGDDVNAYLKEARLIRDALPLAISIDNFIDSHRGNKKIAICGKLSIIRAILESERSSLLYFDKNNRNTGLNFSALDNTWYLPLFQLMTENCQIDDLQKRLTSITFIVFNYDRCIEHFLFQALQKYYRISEAEASELINQIDIYHPYGSVGSLPWSKTGPKREFGEEPYAEDIIELVEKIKTFTEGTDPSSSDIKSIKAAMSNASRLIFIGFAFHKLNMQLITPDDFNPEKNEAPRCFATTYNISENDKAVINNQISDLYKTNVNAQMANLLCGEFFNEFWRSLAF